MPRQPSRPRRFAVARRSRVEFWSTISVNLPTVPHRDNEHEENVVVDFVNDPEVPRADPPLTGSPNEPLGSARAWLPCK